MLLSSSDLAIDNRGVEHNLADGRKKRRRGWEATDPFLCGGLVGAGESGQRVVNACEAAGEGQDEADDLVQLVDVETVLVALGGPRQLVDAAAQGAAELLVLRGLLAEAQPRRAQHVELARDARHELLLRTADKDAVTRRTTLKNDRKTS